MSFQPAVLLITDALALPATAVLWSLRTFEDKTDAGRRLAIVTKATQPGSLKFEPSSLDVVVSLAENVGFHSLVWLVELAKLLKPGGVIVVREPQTAELQTKATLGRSLLLAGYIGSEDFDMVEVELSHTLDGNSALPCVTIRAQKPTWETGTSFSIRKKPPKMEESSSKINAGVLKLSSDEVFEMGVNVFSNGSATLKFPTLEVDSDDLIDEDSLLTEADLRKPELPKVDDCEVGKTGRKACKNCTCGRAEMEQAGEGLTAERLNNPQSACGSCGLGDAFRCSGCPYKGLPPFKLGEKVALSGTLLTADV